VTRLWSGPQAKNSLSASVAPWGVQSGLWWTSVVAGLEAVRAGAAAVAGKTVLVLHRSTRAVQTTTPSAILGRYRLTNRQADTPEFQLWTLRPLLPIVTA